MYLGNDTWAMPAAAALDKKVVVIMSEAISKENEYKNYFSYYARFYPLCKDKIVLRPKAAIDECKDHLICGGCIKDEPHCIKHISPKKVSEAVKILI